METDYERVTNIINAIPGLYAKANERLVIKRPSGNALIVTLDYPAKESKENPYNYKFISLSTGSLFNATLAEKSNIFLDQANANLEFHAYEPFDIFESFRQPWKEAIRPKLVYATASDYLVITQDPNFMYKGLIAHSLKSGNHNYLPSTTEMHKVKVSISTELLCTF